jgi:hypothetical protein
VSDSRFVTVRNDGIAFHIPEVTIDRLGYNIATNMSEAALMAWQQMTDEQRREAIINSIFGCIPRDAMRNTLAAMLKLPVDDVFIPRKKK